MNNERFFFFCKKLLVSVYSEAYAPSRTSDVLALFIFQFPMRRGRYARVPPSAADRTQRAVVSTGGGSIAARR